MSDFKIYYSRSNEVGDGEINPLLQILIENMPIPRSNVLLTKHARGTTYNPQLVREADLVVVAVPGFSDPEQASTIAKGCYTEIEKSLLLGTPVVVICMDHEKGRVFIQTISTHDINLEDSTIWERGYGSVFVYGDRENCDSTLDFRPGELNINEECVNFGAWIDNKSQLKSVFKLMYPNMEFDSKVVRTSTQVTNSEENSGDNLLLLSSL